MKEEYANLAKLHAHWEIKFAAHAEEEEQIATAAATTLRIIPTAEALDGII